jgi:hypothetical protein
MNILLIRPEEIGKGRAFFYSDKIINEMTSSEQLDVVGISNAIALTCQAVQMSTEIASVNIKEISLNYISLPIFGNIGGIIFTLSQKPDNNWGDKKNSIEEKMDLTFRRDGQIIVVSKSLPPETMIPLTLRKLSKAEKIKLMGSGQMINRVANLALEITKGKISRDKIGIELIVLSSKKFTTPQGEKSTTNLEIFLKKGLVSTPTRRHSMVLSELRKI